MRLKTCGLCKLEKPVESFSKRKAAKDGLHSRCKECDRENSAKWRAENIEKAKETQREWRNANAEKIKAYYSANSESLIKRVLEWKKANPGKANAHNAKRYATKLKATPMWADHEAIALFYEEAEFASEFFEISFHVDHIVPLRSKIVCGLHNQFNLQVLEGVENLKKSNRFWPDMPD